MFVWLWCGVCGEFGFVFLFEGSEFFIVFVFWWRVNVRV